MVWRVDREWGIDVRRSSMNGSSSMNGNGSTNGNGSNGHARSAAAASPGWKVPLASPRLLESELQALTDSYRSGWLCMGPRTAELEASMRSYTGAGHAIAVSSCTAALHIACLAAGLESGDTVVVPSLAFAATVNPVLFAGAAPRFADVAAVDRPWLSAAASAAATSAPSASPGR